MNKEARVPTLYGVGDQERLTASDPEEAAAEHVESIYPDKPEKVIPVQGYAPMIIGDHYFDSLLEQLEENIGEDFSDPDGDPEPIPDSAMVHWKAFVAAVREDMHVWSCEAVGDPVEIESAQFIENNP